MPNLNIAYTWAINTCNAPNVGYDQPKRNKGTSNGITYYDCSSFVYYALQAGGFPNTEKNSAFTTRNMRDKLRDMGFYEIPKNSLWLPGDIAWREGHTEIVYEGRVGSGRTMGAHSKYIKVDGKKVLRPLASQVSINSGFSSDWEHIYRYGVGGASGVGYSLYVIAAIIGNFYAESGVNPARTREVIGDAGYGLGQWTDTTTGDRRTRLENYLTSHGYALTDGNGQCEYLIVENSWINHWGNYETLSDFLNSKSQDLRELTYAFMRNWERIDGNIEKRYEFAIEAYHYIENNGNNTAIKNWHYSHDPITHDQALENAVLVWRYFSIAGGGGGGTLYTEHHMPVWMMLRPY